MENKEQKKTERKSTATVRKAFKHGQKTQKMMSFRVDYEVWEMLENEENKGRLINELLKEHYKNMQKKEA